MTNFDDQNLVRYTLDGTGPDPHLPVLVRDLMTANPVTVEPTATVKDVAEIMLARDVHSVPVVDVGDVFIGMVSEADLICREGCPSPRSHHLSDFVDSIVVEHRHHWQERVKGLTAGEIMTTDVVSCGPDEPVRMVTRRMLQQDLRTLPVLDGECLVGVLSRHDVLRLFDRPDPEIRERLAALLGSALWSPEDHHAQATVADGVVTLNGWVHYESEVESLGGVVRQVPGVIEVINKVTAKKAGAKPTFSPPPERSETPGFNAGFLAGGIDVTRPDD
jgi:CBS domain-containing protein